MAVNCGVSFGVCRVRITKVDAAGNVDGTTDNSYVTDAVTSFSVTPNISEGDTFTQLNGCGCKVASVKAPNVFNHFDLTLVNSKMEPIMQAYMLGAATIDDGSDVVGLAFPTALECDEDEPAVAIEVWSQHNVGSGQDGLHPWIHWVFPKSVWQLGDNTFENGIATPTLTGFTRTNSNWGDGPYGDGPPDSQDISEGGWWKTADDPPAAECAAGDVTPSS
jgi:hypothetical protein